MNKTQDYVGKHVMGLTDEERVAATATLPLLSISEFGLLKRRMWIRWVGARYSSTKETTAQKVRQRKAALAEKQRKRLVKHEGVL